MIQKKRHILASVSRESISKMLWLLLALPLIMMIPCNSFGGRDAVRVEEFGARGGGADDTDAVQAALNSEAKVIILSTDYTIKRALHIPNEKTLRSEGRYSSRIQKKVNEDGIDAILVLDSAPAYGITLENLILQGQGKRKAGHAIYAKQCNTIVIKNIWIEGCAKGIFTNDSWLSILERVTIVAPEIGIDFRQQSPGASTGTTLTATNIYVIGATKAAYNFERLYYSVLTNLACDDSTAPGGQYGKYTFRNCYSIVLNGSGAENGSGSSLFLENSMVTVNGFHLINPGNITNNGALGNIHIQGNSQATFSGCYLPNMIGSGNMSDIYVGRGASAVLLNSPCGQKLNVDDASSLSMVDAQGFRRVRGNITAPYFPDMPFCESQSDAQIRGMLPGELYQTNSGEVRIVQAQAQ